MKRTPALPLAALAVAISFGASACGDDSPNASNEDGTTEAPDTTAAPDTTEATETTEAPESGDVPTVETATPVLVGLTEDEAAAAAEAIGWEIRATRIDGEDQAMTMDLRENRVNVAVEDGVVTEVLNIG